MQVRLLVADLLIASGTPDAPGAGPLPALEAMLARGTMHRTAGTSLEHWLAARFGLNAGGEPPLAPLSLLGEAVDPASDCWLRADPVHMELRRDRVVLAAPGSLDLTAAEAAALVGALNAHFAPAGLEFIAPHPGRWYVRTERGTRVRTTPAAEAVAPRMETLLPEGEDGARWRSVMNEAQMLLHAHPCNEARAERGARPVNGIWPWGAGRLPDLAADPELAGVWTCDPLAAGIARRAGLPVHPLPEGGFAALTGQVTGPDKGEQLVVLDRLREARAGGPGAWREALSDCERRWFAPLWEGLKRGAPAAAMLHGLGPEFGLDVSLARNAALRLWRRRRPLAAYA